MKNIEKISLVNSPLALIYNLKHPKNIKLPLTSITRSSKKP